MLDYTHNICHAGQYVYAVQHGNASSHRWNTAIQGALGLLNAAKVPGFYTGTHFAYHGGMAKTRDPEMWHRQKAASRGSGSFAGQALNETRESMSQRKCVALPTAGVDSYSWRRTDRPDVGMSAPTVGGRRGVERRGRPHYTTHCKSTAKCYVCQIGETLQGSNDFALFL